MELIERMRQRILEIGDPDSNYTQEDFNNEFKTEKLKHMPTFKLQLKYSNTSNNEDPKYATNLSSGFDFRANLDKPFILEKGKRGVIPTGIFFEIPENFEIQVRPRSGLAAKNGVTVLNTPGTIDADYRGEIKIILINLGDEDFTINHGDRIAQGVFASVLSKNIVDFIKVDKIDENTERGSGGFGSTGSK